MRGVIVTLALAGATAVGPAAAQGVMGAADARRTFFGIDMEGVHQPSGLRWRECIDPQGRTTYWFAETIDQGVLTVRDDGALCFAYASRGYQDKACWRIRPQGRGVYRFEHADGESGVFVTTSTRRVRVCQGADTPMS
ncbi:MAG: hypothetical protein NW200_04485 [Hyphomonadaceae bacterium]|nr:hypothetical protein [Hyphomonadaceae bacterium]